MADISILQVLTDDDRRGAQVFGFELGERMRELGAEVRTVALAPGRVGGLPVEVLGPSRVHPSTLRALRRSMGAADITAAHGSTTLVACGLAGIGPGRPFVYRQISDPVFWTPTRRKRWQTRIAYRSAAHVVALSPSTGAVLQERFGLDERGITVIPNAVDERRCPAATAEERAAARRRLDLPASPAPVLGYVGALATEKGVADVLDAAPADATVVIAGDGPARADLESEATRREVRCRFLGAMEDPWDVYAAADVFVLASRAGDTQPAVLIEAALVGTPIVTTDVGAITDIVIDQRTGLVCSPGDVPQLTGAISELLRDEPARAGLAAAARDHALESFSMSAVARSWLETLARTAGIGGPLHSADG